MKVLVTGHKGFIGTVMVPILLKEGFEVTGLDTDLYRYCTYGDSPIEIPTIDKDVRDVAKEDLRGFDAIVHLAALSNDPLGDINADLTYDINHKASVRIAEMAREVGVGRFLFASSCSMYGKAGDDILDETAEFNPVTNYARSKVYVERDVAPMASDSFSPVFLRNATAHGVSPRIRFDLAELSTDPGSRTTELPCWDFHRASSSRRRSIAWPTSTMLTPGMLVMERPMAG